MNERLTRLATNFRREGFSWLTKRIAAEQMNPTTTVGRGIHLLARRGVGIAAATPRLLRRTLASEHPASRDALFAFYDLQVAPVTFDFLWFLAAAELQRRRCRLRCVHVVIVPGSHERVRRERDDYEKIVDPLSRQARIYNVLIPACRLLPSVSSVSVAASRADASFIRSVVARHILPTDYEIALPVFSGPHACLQAARAGETDLACLRAPAEELRAVTAWARRKADGRAIVTITLRRYGYMPARNSNLPAWIAFARSLDARRYFPIFIPDTNDTIQGLPASLRELTVFPEAAWNVGLRMALYEHAFLNLGVNNGPMGLAWLNARVRYATLKIETPGVPQSSLEFIRSFGFEVGKSLPFAGPLQEWVWEDDTEEAIAKTFQRLTEKIEAGLNFPDRSRNAQTDREVVPAHVE